MMCRPPTFEVTMNLSDLESLARGIAPVLAEMVADAVKPLTDEIDALKDQLTAQKTDFTAYVERSTLTAEAMEQFKIEAAEHAQECVARGLEAARAALPPPISEADLEIKVKGLVEGAFGTEAQGLHLAGVCLTDELRDQIREYVDALPREPGEPGKDADPELIRSMVAEAVALIPTPENGADGRDGVDGKDGQGVTIDDLTPLIERAVEAAVANIELPKDGRDGTDGKDGADGRDGEKGADGTDGKDGVGLAGALLDKSGALIVTLTDGSMRELGLVVGRDGVDGAKGDPGRDGLQVTDFDTDLSADGRFLTLSLQNDEAKIEHRLQLPTMIYRGGFKEGETYLEGDCVTFGGSLWHCSAETTEKPIEGRDCWQLAARKGRDGKDAKA